LGASISARAYMPVIKGERAVNRRHWIITSPSAPVMAEEPSLYKAIHSLVEVY
jgi:hypothetical protein